MTEALQAARNRRWREKEDKHKADVGKWMIKGRGGWRGRINKSRKEKNTRRGWGDHFSLCLQETSASRLLRSFVLQAEWHPASLSSLVTLPELMKSEQLITEAALATHYKKTPPLHLASAGVQLARFKMPPVAFAKLPAAANFNNFPVRKTIMQMWRTARRRDVHI